MKTTIIAKIVIDTDKYDSAYEYASGENLLTLSRLKREINVDKNYELEWINSDLQTNPEPTLIIKIKGSHL